MKKTLYIIIFIPILTFSQRFELKVGAEYRITPIQKDDETFYLSNVNVYYNEDKQLMGTSFGYTISYLLKNGFGFGFSHSFKYGHIYYKPSKKKVLKSVNGLITDYKLFIKKEFYLKKNIYFIEFGGSLMNNGTQYAEKDYVDVYDENDNQLYWLSSKNFSFNATNLTIGVVFENFDVGLGMYFSKGSENFSTMNKFKIPYFKVRYIIF
jgi:hypothetical protein